MHVDAPVVLQFLRAFPLMAACKLYSGGLVFELRFGDYIGHTLDAGRVARRHAYHAER